MEKINPAVWRPAFKQLEIVENNSETNPRLKWR